MTQEQNLTQYVVLHRDGTYRRTTVEVPALPTEANAAEILEHIQAYGNHHVSLNPGEYSTLYDPFYTASNIDWYKLNARMYAREMTRTNPDRELLQAAEEAMEKELMQMPPEKQAWMRMYRKDQERMFQLLKENT